MPTTSLQVLLFGLVLGCQEPSLDPGPNLDELLAAPESISVGGFNLSLEAYLWRNFQPTVGTDPHHTKLIALTWIVESDSLTLPQSLRANRIWIVHEEEVWGSNFSDEPRPPNPPFKLKQVARRGPRWPVGALVDVVIRIRWEGVDLLLRKADEPIRRAD